MKRTLCAPVSPTASQSLSQKTIGSDSFEDMPNNEHSSLFVVEEDHFSVHSDIDFLDEIEIRSNFSNEEQLEATISRCTAYLNSLSSNNDNQLSDEELEEKKRQIVKRICDLKVKLAKLQEEEELEEALKECIPEDVKHEYANDNNTVLFFKRIYSLKRHVAGHKLVPSTDIYENEKRIRNIWRNHLRNTHTAVSSSSSPLSLSPPTSPSGFLSQTFSTSRLLQLLNNTSTHLSSLAGNWTNIATQATNPFAQLVCDQCLKRASKSFNDFFAEAFKFAKKPDHPLACSPCLQTGENVRKSNNNPYLVCIYCFFTIHLNCLSRVIRKCPKSFFDDDKNEQTNEYYFHFYDAQQVIIKNDLSHLSLESASLIERESGASASIDRHRKRMRRVILKICPEIGLAKQEFRCAECKVLLSPSSSSSSSCNNKPRPKVVSRARLCDYSGLYFCENCHIGDTAIIPARVIHNWDFRPQPVSRAALQIISYLKNTAFHFDRPVLFNLVEINPMLYGLVDELVQIKRLRSELSQIYKYISLCKQPSKPRHWIAVMCQLGAHLLSEQEVSYLSFTDICDLKTLANNLSELETLFINHINSCESCQGRGFFCELCPNKDNVLFPFSPNTATCSQCYAVYHKNCYFRRNRICPRCNRIKDKFAQRQLQQQLNEQADDMSDAN